MILVILMILGAMIIILAIAMILSALTIILTTMILTILAVILAISAILHILTLVLATLILLWLTSLFAAISGIASLSGCFLWRSHLLRRLLHSVSLFWGCSSPRSGLFLCCNLFLRCNSPGCSLLTHCRLFFRRSRLPVTSCGSILHLLDLTDQFLLFIGSRTLYLQLTCKQTQLYQRHVF